MKITTSNELGARTLKLSLVSLAICSFLIIVCAAPVSAQTGYQLLEPLPGVNATTTPSNYIEGIFRLIIGIATVLAVIMIIFGGIKYMSTDAFSGKNEAKDTIQNALWGLFLAMGAWLILFTINPDLVNFNLSIDRQATENLPGLSPGGTPTSSPITRGPSDGNPWGSDAAERVQLSNGVPNISVVPGSCTQIGQSGCTSLTGASQQAINSVRSLALACLNANPSCTVTITGGTEYWLHGNRNTELPEAGTAHRPGGNVLDLRYDSGATGFIRANGTQVSGSSSCAPGIGQEYWTYDGATYVYETNPAHWHVCF